MPDEQERPLAEQLKQIEARLAALEAAAAPQGNAAQGFAHPTWPLALGLVALAPGYMGLGLPQHYDQPLFAALVLLVAYHRGGLRTYAQPWRWVLVALNFLLALLFFKLLIGAGVSHPFDWLKLPTLQPLPAQDDGWAQRVLPRYQVVWEAMPVVGEWALDLTRLQSVLLLATLAGALLRFQPFASLTALVLLVISVPSYMRYSWDEVVMFLVLGGTAVALQVAPPRRG